MLEVPAVDDPGILDKVIEKAQFYERVNRRPLIDIVQDAKEAKEQSEGIVNSNDLTLYSWRNDWLENVKKNKEHFGYFNRDHSVKVFFNELAYKPCVLVGAGPSLAKNIEYLKLAQQLGIKIMCSSHAFMYLCREEYKIKPDYVVVLDAGKNWGDYLATPEDQKGIPLLTDQTCNHDQLKSWAGPVYFFKSAHPSDSNIGKYMKMEMERVIHPLEGGSIVQVAGHVMGAMLGLARGVMSTTKAIFVGADYCFSPESAKFYPFDHKIDQEVEGTNFGSPGKMLPSAPPEEGKIMDIFGQVVGTNGAYLSFKNIIDQGIKENVDFSVKNNVDFQCINATEGGALGALEKGNSKYLSYMRLEDACYRAAQDRDLALERFNKGG